MGRMGSMGRMGRGVGHRFNRILAQAARVYYALVRLDDELLLRVLGAAMVVMCAHEFILTRVHSIHLSPRIGLPFALLSSILSGAFGMGEPSAVSYILQLNRAGRDPVKQTHF